MNTPRSTRRNPVYTAMIIITVFWSFGVYFFILKEPEQPSPESSPTRLSQVDIVDDTRGDLSQCPHMSYWKPRSKADLEFVSPYALFRRGSAQKYATFEPDYGGFNNIRMTLETLLVFAKATGRTIVLPPRSPIYLLKDTPITNGSSAESNSKKEGEGKGVGEETPQKPNSQPNPKVKKLLSATDFFSEGLAQLTRQHVVEVISFREFVRRESHVTFHPRGGGVAQQGLISKAAVRLHGKKQEQERADGGEGVVNKPSRSRRRLLNETGVDTSEEQRGQENEATEAVTKAASFALLAWNDLAEAGDDGARKKIRAWIRAATCEPRPLPPPSSSAARKSASGAGVGGRGSAAGGRGGGGDARSGVNVVGYDKKGALLPRGSRSGGSGGGRGGLTKNKEEEEEEEEGVQEAMRSLAAAAGDAARCPRWEPLKEAVVFGNTGSDGDVDDDGNGDGGGDHHHKRPQQRKRAAAMLEHRGSLVPALTEDWPWTDDPSVPPSSSAASSLLSHRFTLPQFLTEKRRAQFVDRPSVEEEWVHFQTDMKNPARPLFSHWYTLFLFQDFGTDLFMKRMVRDYVHYDDAVFCAAGRIVAKLDAEAAARSAKTTTKGGSSSKSRGWSSMHVRHGELQYTNVQISPSQLLDATKEWLNVTGELLYVATDEPLLSWFDPLLARHQTRFLHDFKRELEGLPPNLYGMVEQVVLAGGRTFTGTWFSTFSAYVCRLRGYYGLPSDTCFVYAPEQKKLDFQHWKLPSHAFYPREWALAWEGLDFDRHNAPTAPFGEGVAASLSPHRLYYEPFVPDALAYPDAAVKKKKAAQKAEASAS